MTRFIYVRHGESNSTVTRTIGGHRTCTGLSELGHQQAAGQRVLDALSRDRVGQVGRVADPQHLARGHPRAALGAREMKPAWAVLGDRQLRQHPGPHVAGDEQLEQRANIGLLGVVVP